jgi:ATP-dependent exoDNAse (exonuclease V) alpha subunit
VIALGDPGQLGPVEAGGWLAAIAREQDGPELRQVMRQRDKAEQAALQALHDGDPALYLEHKRDAITVHEKEFDALVRLVETWHDAQQQNGRRAAVMITRVIARHNDRSKDVDNGSLGTVATIGRDGSMVIETDAGESRALDATYVAAHVEHAYVLTAHGAQGGTFTWAGVVGRPTEFTREWAYTALSRACDHTAIHLISQRTERD